jgi:hypothetical protein
MIHAYTDKISMISIEIFDDFICQNTDCFNGNSLFTTRYSGVFL